MLIIKNGRLGSRFMKMAADVKTKIPVSIAP